MNFLEMLNTIRDNASKEYQKLIPEATKESLNEIGGLLVTDPELQNEFTNAFMNKVAFVVAHNKIFKNPLAILKKGSKPLADTVEEVFVNYAKGEEFDPAGTDLLKRNIPDVKVIYHRMNRKGKYKTTISPEMLMKAFRSLGDFRNFYNQIINSLYNGDNKEEFLLFKQLLANAVKKNYVKQITLDGDPAASKEYATSFIKAVKTISGAMEFPSTEYNGYLDAFPEDASGTGVETFSTVPEQLIIIDNATDVAIDVDVLANAFNLTKQEFLARKIKIDAFPDKNIRAMIVDESFTQIYDDLYQLKKFENAEGLYENWILHHWQTLDVSCLVNAVAFVVGSDSDKDGNVEKFTITKNVKDGASLTNNIASISEGLTYGTTVKGEFTTVTVKVGGSDVTSTVYNSETNKITVENVTADIEITVA